MGRKELALALSTALQAASRLVTSTGPHLDAATKTHSSFTTEQLSIPVKNTSTSPKAPNPHYKVVLVSLHTHTQWV